MQDDTITTKSEEQSEEGQEKKEATGTSTESTQEAEHNYYEVGGDLLSKPNVLCDILEVSDPETTVVFCNTPSEADFVDVILKKRSFTVCKLVGHVPAPRVISALKEAKNGDFKVLIVTDVAARELEVEELELVVNYSIPADPEVYIHRMGRDGHGGSLNKIISLVSPADLTNFHYLKKIVGFDFTKLDLPGQEAMMEVKVKNLGKEAAEFVKNADESTKKAVSLIMNEGNKDDILTLLTHNTFNVIPELRASVNERSEEGLQNSGRNRNSRTDKRGGRSSRDRDQSDTQRSRGGRGDSRRGRDNQRQNQDDDYDRDDAQPERERRRQDPPAKELRIYVGHGTDSGMSEEKLNKTISESKDMEGYNVTRTTVRKCYSFVDFPEGTGDEVVDKLNKISLNDKETLFARKATLISVPRPPKKEEDDNSEEADMNEKSASDSENEQQEQAGQEQP